MSPQLYKEFRCLLPAAVAALLVPGAVELLDFRHTFGHDGGLVLFGLFTAFVGASSFGCELSESRLPLLLAQPVSRKRLWFLKAGVLLATLMVTFIPLALCTSLPAYYYLWLFLPAICALGITPWLTLLFRDGFLAAVITILIEAVILALVCQAFRWRELQLEERLPSPPRYAAAVFVVFLCGLVGLIAGYRTLRNWRAVPARRPRLSWLGFRSRRTSPAPRRSERTALASLLLKELRLHTLSLIWLAALALMLGGFLWDATADHRLLKGLIQVNLFFVPVVLGAVTVARERELGILDVQLALPIPARRQWAIKLLVCFSLVLIGGIALPWLLVNLRAALHPLASSTWYHPFPLLPLLLMATALVVLSSSVTRGMLRASVLGLAIVTAFIIYSDWFGRNILASDFYRHILEQIVQALPEFMIKPGLALVALTALGLVLRHALHHFRHPHAVPSTVRLVLGTVGLVSVFLVAELTLTVLVMRPSAIVSHGGR